MVRHLALAICIALLSGCDVSGPVSPVEKTTTADSFFPIPQGAPPPDTARPWEFRDYPRTRYAEWSTITGRLDLLPVTRFYDTATRYTGVTAPRTGTCRTIPVHGFRHRRDNADTLRLDMWLTTDCIGMGGNYNELRLLWDMRSARFPVMNRATITITKPGSTDTATHRFIWSRSVLTRYEDPTGYCQDRPAVWQLSASPVIPIPTLWTCREHVNGFPPGDTLRLTVTIEPPVLEDGYTCLPTPALIVAEVTDTRNAITAYAPLFFLTCSP